MHDAVRIATPDLDETIRRFVEHVTAPSPLWTYSPVRRVASPLLARELPLSAALAACERRGSAVSRRMNAEVAQLVWDAGEGRTMQCYPLSRRYFSIRHDLQLRIPADFYLVEQGRPVVFWLQPRKGFALDDFGRRLLASVVHRELSLEWDEFDFEMLDTSPLSPGEARCARTFRFADLPLLSEREIAAVMQQFADAFDVVSEMDLTPARNSERRTDQPDAGQGMFGDL